jgi:hypothetical protein
MKFLSYMCVCLQLNLEEISVLETSLQPNLEEISVPCVCVCCNCWLNVGQFRNVIISWQLIIKQSYTCNQAVFLETLESELSYETLAKINWDFFFCWFGNKSFINSSV